MNLKLSYRSVQEEYNMSVQKVSPALRLLLRASYIKQCSESRSDDVPEQKLSGYARGGVIRKEDSI
jgi:hypothetical protein